MRVTMSFDDLEINCSTVRKTVTTAPIIKTMAVASARCKRSNLLRLETASNKIHEFIVDVNGLHLRSLYSPRMPFAFSWKCGVYLFFLAFDLLTSKTVIVGVILSCVLLAHFCYLHWYFTIVEIYFENGHFIVWYNIRF